MVDKSNEYGFVGASPTQSSSANTGIFEVNDVVDLLQAGQYKLQFYVEHLVIAGGASGGVEFGGGGGAGGYRCSVLGENSGGGDSAEDFATINPDGTTYTVTIGAGGAGRGPRSVPGASSPSDGISGNNSVFATITSTGGGAGGGVNPDQPGTDGGSGGGSGRSTSDPGLGTSGQGFDGGNAPSGNGGAGGGGASEVGYNQPSTNNGGAGGDGVASSITGSSVTRAGGGGGAGYGTVGGSGGAGGAGGGGAGLNTSAGGAGGTGAVNTGSGGGAGGYNGAGNSESGPGGSGVVILRYPSAYDITTSGLTTSSKNVVDGDEKYTVITAGIGGTVSWS